MSNVKANYSTRGYQVYGDVDNVQKDSKVLAEILSRQGSDLLLEVIANQVGNTVVKFSLKPAEVDAIKASLRLSLDELIGERT